jgi:hypothetical protein
MRHPCDGSEGERFLNASAPMLHVIFPLTKVKSSFSILHFFWTTSECRFRLKITLIESADTELSLTKV